jgi:hypothetical protein
LDGFAATRLAATFFATVAGFLEVFSAIVFTPTDDNQPLVPRASDKGYLILAEQARSV